MTWRWSGWHGGGGSGGGACNGLHEPNPQHQYGAVLRSAAQGCAETTCLQLVVLALLPHFGLHLNEASICRQPPGGVADGPSGAMAHQRSMGSPYLMRSSFSNLSRPCEVEGWRAVSVWRGCEQQSCRAGTQRSSAAAGGILRVYALCMAAASSAHQQGFGTPSNSSSRVFCFLQSGGWVGKRKKLP